ncbi:MAG: DUF805 domain-containing protein [Planctomycetaceae bacterium]|nr:DUF805 domain-containing protein [Planctomycetaceae bacterium]
MKWYLEVLRKYAVFSGRARRKEYWMFTLFNTLIASAIFIAAVLASDVATVLTKSGHSPLSSLSIPLILAFYLYALAVLVPCVAVTVRRLHDTGQSGWLCLLYLVPTFGTAALLVFMLLDSAPGQNQYGPNPKQAVARPAVV